MIQTRCDGRRGPGGPLVVVRDLSRHSLSVVVVVVAAVSALSGCSGPGSATVSIATGPAAAQPDVPGEGSTVPRDSGLPTELPAPVTGPAATSAALTTAAAAVTAFTRHDPDPASWWSTVLPFLSPTAAQAYLGTDPELVPAEAVVGEPELLPGPTELLAVVAVPTDTGTCSVLLTRTDDGTAWLVARFAWDQGEIA